MKPPITLQREAVEQAYNALIDTPHAPHLKQAALTLAWIERKAELVKAVDMLDREQPALAEVLAHFPGTKIAALPKMFEDGDDTP